METHPFLLMRDRGWECPRCMRVWNPAVILCGPCEPPALTPQPVPAGEKERDAWGNIFTLRKKSP